MRTWYVIRDGSAYFSGFNKGKPAWTADVDRAIHYGEVSAHEQKAGLPHSYRLVVMPRYTDRGRITGASTCNKDASNE